MFYVLFCFLICCCWWCSGSSLRLFFLTFLRGRLRLHINSSRFFVSIYLRNILFCDFSINYVWSLFVFLFGQIIFGSYQNSIVLILTSDIQTHIRMSLLTKKEVKLHYSPSCLISDTIFFFFFFRLLWHLYWPNAIMIDLFGLLIANIMVRTNDERWK